ncbi:transcription termination factor 4, mitochondrial isoform X4 [Canis lupus baileyi]|uniref:transcription termination factor 4, mitochondrial isoform X4 n=1 Tax=Canis lupus baileyi TaxID=143281 RepID=UPI003B97197A
MAALGGQVLGGARTWARTWPRTWARTWAGLAAQPRGGQRRTAASRGGGRGARGPGARGEVAGALLAMGFSDAHVRGLLSVWRGARPRRVLDVVSELILLGVSPEHVCLALRSSPRLLDLPAAHAQRRSGYLRRLGLGEGKLKTLLLCCPEVFTMHQRDIENIVGVLKDKCLFTGQQVTRILHRCPYVLREDPGDLEYKFQACKTWSGNMRLWGGSSAGGGGPAPAVPAWQTPPRRCGLCCSGQDVAGLSPHPPPHPVCCQRHR